MASSKETPEVEEPKIIVETEVEASEDVSAKDEATIELDASDSVENDVEAESADENSAAQEADIDEVEAPLDDASDTDSDPQPIEKIIVKRGGFIPTVIGGALCVAIGYAGAQFVKPDGWPFPGASTAETSAQIEALIGRIDQVESKNATLENALNDQISAATTSVEDRLSAKIDAIDLSSSLAPLAEQITTLEARLTTVEAAPVAEAIVSPQATAAYERQLDEMRTLLAGEITRLEEKQAQANADEADAILATAAARLQQRVDQGEPFADLLEVLEVDIPDALNIAAPYGVLSAEQIEKYFETAARDALKNTAQAAHESGEASWAQTVLRTQLGLRSTSPKAGDSVDAILSRAQQSVRDERFAEAILEIKSLPEAGQEAMSSWVELAQSRADVIAALDEMLGQ